MLPENFPAIIPSVLAVMSLTFIPFLMVMGTAFTKITIVLMLLRNALGVQQVPSGIVINSIALCLTLFIMVPVGDEIIKELQKQPHLINNWESALNFFEIISRIFSDYLQRFANERELAFFMDAARKLWPESLHEYIRSDNFFLLLPSHVISEITRAFEIAFLLFLPFVIVDMIVSNILLAMGAMMVPPMLVSLPIKIFLFVAADGWARLLHNLVLSYI